MPAKTQKSPSALPPAEEKFQKVELTIGASRDVPVQWANKVIVNFVGTQFLVTLMAAAPEPWVGKLKGVPKKVEAKVLARYAFSVPEWAEAVKSFANQIQKLQADGVFSIEVVKQEE